MKRIKRLDPVKHAGLIAEVRRLWADRGRRPITQTAIARMFNLSVSTVSALVNYRICIGGGMKKRDSYDILWLPPETPPEDSDADAERAERLADLVEADALFFVAMAGRSYVDRGAV